MSDCKDGVVLTNDPDHPYVQCQRCGELEAHLADWQIECSHKEATIAELRERIDQLEDENAGLAAAAESLGMDNAALLEKNDGGN
jgi:chromosome segregation ATPase